MKTDKQFYKQFFSLFFLLVLQNIITISVNLTDNMMLGAYSEEALSGVTAVNQVQFVYQQILTALGDGIVIIGSQYWGKKEIGPIKKLSAIGMQVGMSVALILTVLTVCFPKQILHLFTDHEGIVENGISYLCVIRCSYFFFAWTMLSLAVMRSVEIVGIAFRVSLITLVINCSINYILIYGRFGAPELGAVGAAIGTLTARIVECVVVSIYLFKVQKRLPIKISDFLKNDWKLFKKYAKITAPICFIQGAWGCNVALQTVILGHMTAAAIAANSAASTLYLMAKSAAVGAVSTASVLIGKSIGEGNILQVRDNAKRLQKLFVMIGLCSAVFLFLIRIPVLSVYRLSDEAAGMANTFLLILCFICFTMSYQMPVNNGIIRGGGDVKFTVIVDLISIWCIVLPLSFFMAFVIEASPVVVVCCLNADQVFKCIPAFLRVNYGNWIKKLT